MVANAAIAYRLRPRLGTARPTSPLLERYREMLESRLVWVMLALGALSGCSPAARPAVRCCDYLAWQHSTPFDVTDPQFGWTSGSSSSPTRGGGSCCRSCSPRWSSGHRRRGSRALHDGRRCGSAASAGAAAERPRRTCRSWSVWRCWSRASATGSTSTGWRSNAPTGSFTGIYYTADHATVNAKMILAIIAGICALLFFANAVLRRWVVPVIGLILLLLSAIVLGLVYPGAVQYFSVRPDEPDKERSYIAGNIAATRAAYAVDNVEITDYSAKTTATAGQLRTDAEALPGIRLIDPTVVGPAYEQLQQVRGYYTFPKTLDVDRYTIDGKETDAVVAVREMDLSGLEDELEQPEDRLHPRLRAGRRVRQPAAVRRRARVDRQGHPARPGRSTSTSRGSTSASCRVSARTVLHRRRTAPAGRRSSWTPPVAARAATRRPTPTPARAACRSATCGTGCCTPRSSPTSTSCSPTGSTSVQDHLRPDPAGAGAGRRAVAEGRRRRLSGRRARAGSSGSSTATPPPTPTRTASG